jgi:hypothetical protein
MSCQLVKKVVFFTKVCLNYLFDKMIKIHFFLGRCGQRLLQCAKPKIAGGDRTCEGEMPWMVIF